MFIRNVIAGSQFIQNWIFYSLGTCDSDSGKLDIPLLVQQVRTSHGMGFQPRSRINNHFDIFLRASYRIRRLLSKSKSFFQLWQKTETNKKSPGRWEQITPLLANHIAQTPQGQHSLTDQKQSYLFKIENGLTAVDIFHLHCWSKEYWITIYYKDDLDSSLFSTYTTPPPL